MDTYIGVAVTILAIVEGILVILNFAKGGKKDSKDNGYQSGIVENKISNMEKTLADIQQEIKDKGNGDRVNTQRISELDANMRIEHERVTDVIRRVESLEKKDDK